MSGEIAEEEIQEEEIQYVAIVREMYKFLDAESGSYRRNTHVAAYQFVLDMLGGLQPEDVKGNAQKIGRANALLATALGRSYR